MLNETKRRFIDTTATKERVVAYLVRTKTDVHVCDQRARDPR